MTQDTTKLRISTLSERRVNNFRLTTDHDVTDRIMQKLNLNGLRKLRFEGTITHISGQRWQMYAELGATAVQTCVISLEPVTTRIDTSVTRLYSPNPPELRRSESEEGFEVPQDDTYEPLCDEIDLETLVTEALVLALPDYPRAENVQLEQTTFTEPGIKPMSDQDAHPFATLAQLHSLADKRQK